MIKLNNINKIYSCEKAQSIIDYFNNNFNIKKGLHPNTILEELNNIYSSIDVCQYLYYIFRTKFKKEFKTKREWNFFGYRYNFFNTGGAIYKCSDIIESNYITKSSYIKYSSYVNRSCYCDHLLFCNNLSHKSYYAFNKPVTPERFKELISLSLTDLKKQPEFNLSIYKMLRKTHKILKGESHNEN